MSALVKVCSCGRHYTRATWPTLPLAPGPNAVACDIGGEYLQFRTCRACRSTIAVEVTPTGELPEAGHA